MCKSAFLIMFNAAAGTLAQSQTWFAASMNRSQQWINAKGGKVGFWNEVQNMISILLQIGFKD